MRAMRTLGKIFGLFLIVGSLSSFDAPKQEYQLKKSAVNSTNIKKSISSFEINKTIFYKVQVKISGASQIKGIAKYEELIPSGYTVTGIFSDYGKANFDSEKAEVTFLTLNGRDDVTITYYLQGELAITPKGDSKFMYLNGDDVALVDIELAN